MYLEHYGFDREPFNITPDSSFLFSSKRHSEALASLLYGINQRKGFIALTGHIGSGKTTLCRALLKKLDQKNTKIALILNPQLNDLELLQAINAEYGIEHSSTSKRELLNSLNKFLLKEYEEDRNCVLVIDESQRLTPDALEQVRLISNLETETTKLIQIALVGQPELDDLLHLPELEQLNQRVTVRFHIDPLDYDEMVEYIEHRIAVANPDHPIKWEKKALKAIFKHSNGVPRKTNVVCDRALLVAFVDESLVITEEHAKKAILEVAGTRDRSRTTKVAKTENISSDQVPASDEEVSETKTVNSSSNTTLIAVMVIVAVVIVIFFVNQSNNQSAKISQNNGTTSDDEEKVSLEKTPSEIEAGPEDIVVAEAPTPSPTPEPTPSPTPQPTPTPPPAPTPYPSPTPYPTPTPYPSPTPLPSPTPTPEPEITPAPVPEIADDEVGNVELVSTPTSNPTPTADVTPEQTPEATPVEPAPNPDQGDTVSEAPEESLEDQIKFAESDVNYESWTYDSEGILRVESPETFYVSSILTWLNLSLDSKLSEEEINRLKESSPETLQRLQLTNGAPPLYLKNAVFPPSLSMVENLNAPFIVQLDRSSKMLSSWCILLSFDENTATVADPVKGMATVPRQAIEDSLASILAPYSDKQNWTGLQLGDQGENVQTLQKFLSRKGAYAGEPNGIFNNATLDAVNSYRTKKGLEESAVIDPILARLMFEDTL